MKQPMNIAFCFDNNYALGYLVTMVSLFENNKDEEINIYIITPYLSQEVISKFDKLSEIYNHSIFYCKVDDKLFEGLPTHGRFNKSTYIRYAIPDLCGVSKILQLDGDLIIRKNLRELYDTDVTDVASAVVEDHNSDDLYNVNRYHLEPPFFNNGVQLMNLDYWRKNHLAEKCQRFLVENPDVCIYMDQDANNIVLKDHVKYLPYTYNFQQFWYKDKLSIKMHFHKWPEIDKYIDDPAIIHYSVSPKPWYYECSHPCQQEFVEYANKYDFVGFKMQHTLPFYKRITRRLYLGIGRRLYNYASKIR